MVSVLMSKQGSNGDSVGFEWIQLFEYCFIKIDYRLEMESSPKANRSQDLLKDHDKLKLANEPKIINQLAVDEYVMYSDHILKFNEDRKCQLRIFLLTNLAVYNLVKTQNIVKAIMKKFVSMQNRYNIRRRISLGSFYGISLSSKPQSCEFVLHVSGEHDYHYKTLADRNILLRQVSSQYERLTCRRLRFYFMEEILLLNVCTHKYHLKEKKDLRPKQSPTYLSETDFLISCVSYSDYHLEYSQDGLPATLDSFQSIKRDGYQAKIAYYVFAETVGKYKAFNMPISHQSILLPAYCFSCNSKMVYLQPFMLGGDLKSYLASRKSLKPHQILFYIAQIILFLEQIHSKGFIYGGILLESIFIKANGYLAFAAQPDFIRQYRPGELHYDLTGPPQCLPPECITCRGYDISLDIWKLGIIAYNLATGTPPLEGAYLKSLFYEILQKPIPTMPLEFINRMLQRNREKRVTIKALKKSADFACIDWDQLGEEKIRAPYVPNFDELKIDIERIVYREKKEN